MQTDGCFETMCNFLLSNSTPISGERRGSEDELDQLLAKEEQLQALLARCVALSFVKVGFLCLEHFQSRLFMINCEVSLSLTQGGRAESSTEGGVA